MLCINPQKTRKTLIKTSPGGVGKAESTDAGSFTPGAVLPRPPRVPVLLWLSVWVLKRSLGGRVKTQQLKAAISEGFWQPRGAEGV